MRDHERHDATPAPIAPAEDHAHHEVADDRTDALVGVVSAAQAGGGQDDGPVVPAEPSQPVEEVADEDHLFGQSRPQCRQHQQRHGPPRRVEGRGDHCDRDPERAPGRVEREPRHADDRGEEDAAAEVSAEPREVQPDAAQRIAAGLPQQVDDERHEGEREEDGEHLVHDIPDRLRVPRRVHLGLLLAERNGREEFAHERQHRVQRGLPDRDREDDPDLPREASAVIRREGRKGSRIPLTCGPVRRRHLVRLSHSASIELRLCNVFADRFDHLTTGAYRFPIRAQVRLPAGSARITLHRGDTSV
ncbi:hypothetical protein RS82_00095 [Microbacterium trichothecenolyticum]|uniref:Uncharacterized protein n=1 Tax=Microbacterium trichothecenolyticum TaxID=69370 RepID=A0A0M2HMH9_MICTR|nr:hypothetical protein RS82_00095 [Microbacterium trichothecenolyticum]